MKKPVAAGVVIISLAALLAGAALANFAKPEDAVEYRQSVMTVIGTHFTRMGAVVKGEQPYDNQAFARDAALVATLIRLPWDAFMTPDSLKGSRMKPEALVQKDKFMALAKANESEVVKLAAAAEGGDLSAVKPQFGAAGASCKACHDAYRNR
jgi:cytochrome c556